MSDWREEALVFQVATSGAVSSLMVWISACEERSEVASVREKFGQEQGLITEEKACAL